MPEPRYPLTADLAGVLAAAAHEKAPARRPTAAPSLRLTALVFGFVQALLRPAFRWRPTRAARAVVRARSA
jgi:hypothetical protein